MTDIPEGKARAAAARDATAQEEDVGGRCKEDNVADVTLSMARAATAVTRLLAEWTAGTSLLKTSQLTSPGGRRERRRP